MSSLSLSLFFFKHIPPSLSSYALSPCPLVNEQLSSLVHLTLRCYSPLQLAAIADAFALNAEARESIANLRRVAVAAEGEMEADGAEAVFEAYEQNPKEFMELVVKLAKKTSKRGKKLRQKGEKEEEGDDVEEEGEDTEDDPHRILQKIFGGKGGRGERMYSDHQLEKIRLLQALVVHAPAFIQKQQRQQQQLQQQQQQDQKRQKKLQQQNRVSGGRTVFQYFVNYITLVHGELQLLKGLFDEEEEEEEEEEKGANELLHRGTKQTRLSSLVPKRREAASFDHLERQGGRKTGRNMKEKTLTNGIEKSSLSTNKAEKSSLSTKTLAFIGSGFPLTGVMLHIMTGGTKVINY